MPPSETSETTTPGNGMRLDVIRPAIVQPVGVCAWSAARTKDTYLSAQFWRLARRIGREKAAIAVGHTILVIAYHVLLNEADYRDLGGDYFARRTDTHFLQQRLVRQLEQLGNRVTLEPIPAA